MNHFEASAWKNGEWWDESSTTYGFRDRVKERGRFRRRRIWFSRSADAYDNLVCNRVVTITTKSKRPDEMRRGSSRDNTFYRAGADFESYVCSHNFAESIANRINWYHFIGNDFYIENHSRNRRRFPQVLQQCSLYTSISFGNVFVATVVIHQLSKQNIYVITR